MTGKASQFPLVRLAAKYNELRKDGRLLSNRGSLEVVRTRIQQLADRIDMNDAPDRLARLGRLWKKYREEWDAGRKVEAIQVMGELDKEFDQAAQDYAAWKQMFDAIDLDRKLVESEVKIMKDINAIMTAEDAYELSAKLLGAIIGTINAMEVEENVKQRALRQISYEFTRIVGDQSTRRSPGGGGEIIDSVPVGLDPEGIPDPGDEA